MPKVDAKHMSFEKALRIFRRKCDNAGIKDRCRELQHYEKPNVKRNQANNYRKRGRKIEAQKALQLELKKRLSMRNKG